MPVPEWGKDNPNLYGLAGSAREILGPILEALAAGGGGLAGALATPELLGAGALPGAGLGYAGARQLTGLIDEYLGNKPPSSLAEAAKKAAMDIPMGAAMGAGGQVAGKLLPEAIGMIRAGMKPSMPWTSEELIAAQSQNAPSLKLIAPQAEAEFRAGLARLLQGTEYEKLLNLKPSEYGINPYRGME